MANARATDIEILKIYWLMLNARPIDRKYSKKYESMVKARILY